MRFVKRVSMFSLIAVFILMASSWNDKHTPANKDRSNIQIIYTGNMGVLINSSTTAVLIDGLHEFYETTYLNPPDSVVNNIINQRSIFAHLNIALFTHYHKDHYSAKLATMFLNFSAERKVAGAPQVTGTLPTGQILNAWNKNKVFFSDSSAALELASYNISHVWQQRHAQVQNIAYIVKMDGINVMHIGDADTDASIFSQYKFDYIDVMIVPLWFLTSKDGIRIIKESVKPGRVITTHISPAEKDGLQQYQLPNISTVFFTTIGETLAVGKPG